MLFLNSVRMAPGVRSVVAVACGLTLSGAGMAQVKEAQESVEPVVVTASRMPQLLQTAPIGATVITAEQIQRSGVADVNEAIRKLAGVVGKTDLFGGREYTLDLRGYGDAASANMVVMVDGLRVSENELISARLTALPLSRVDRIEIVRGGSSVLWGDGATAGVINIILKKGAANSAQMSASVASYGGQDLGFSGTNQVGSLTVDGTVNRVRSEGFREHAMYKQDSGSFGLGFGGDNWSQQFRFQQESQWAQWPGNLTFAQYDQNPRQSTPANTALNGGNDETRVNSHTEVKSGDLTSQLDMGIRRRQYQSNSFARLVDSSQLTPKLIYSTKVSGIDWSAIVGADFQRWSLETPVQYSGGESAHDSHTAVFMNHSLNLPSRTRVDFGYRRERAIKQDETPFSQYDQRSDLDASELGLSQQLDQSLAVYGRVAHSYRLGNLDENGYVQPGFGPLRPQKSRDKEVGLRWLTATEQLNVRLFRQDNIDEIMYAPSPIDGLSYNLNASDPTRRQGLEWDGRWRVTKDLELRATWTQLTARYLSGPFEGKDMAQVAPHSSTLRASYRFDDRRAVELGVQHRSEMRFSGDDDNSCTRRIPASTQFDARYSWTGRDWSFAFGVTNLGNQIGYNYAYSCSAGFLYPEQGRAYKATVTRQF